jgi:site-specific recombinase XerD
MTEAIQQAILRKQQLSIEELKTLPIEMKIQGNQIIIERGLKKSKLKHPVTLNLDKVLATKEKGLIAYIFNAFLCERPALLQYVFDNQSIQKMCRHFLRHCSGSIKSAYTYTANVERYTAWLGNSPDLIISDLKPVGNVIDAQRLQNHIGFVNDYLAELQDQDLTPGAVVNCIKGVKTFYRSNGIKIELTEPLSRRVTYKDRSPTPEELTKILDIADIRTKVIVSLLSLGGFREKTLAKLKYRHVKEDLEANRLPIHIHVEAEILKGKYGDCDTFLGAEAAEYLKLYITERKNGTRRTKPEKFNDETPIIKDEKSSTAKEISEKQIRYIVHQYYVKAGLAKHRNGHYDVRTHSLRKYFKTQMLALGVQPDYVDYFMGHVLDTYHDIQSVGIEKLRAVYSTAGLSIRPKQKISKIDQLKEMVRSLGMNPEQVLSSSALADGAITVQNSEDQQLAILRKQLRELIIAETKHSV